MSRYICPFSWCTRRGCWTAWGIKRHVKKHMDAIHDRLDGQAANGSSAEVQGQGRGSTQGGGVQAGQSVLDPKETT